MKTCDYKFLIDNMKNGYRPLADELCFLLDLNEGEAEYLFAAARKTRNKYFGNKVFLYGFVYLSTFCRNNCTFCGYRKSNQDTVRYRKSPNVLAVKFVILMVKFQQFSAKLFLKWQMLKIWLYRKWAAVVQEFILML